MSETWTVKRLLEWTTDYLKQHARQSPRLEAEILLADALGYQRIELYTNFDSEPSEEQRAKFRDFVKRRAAGEPVAYLVGHKEFFSLRFEVDKHTLIPRPETEQLVLEGLDWIKKHASDSNVRVCDLGTGSGAIAVALAKNASKAQVAAVDISPEALLVAEKNAKKHGVNERIEFVRSDLLKDVSGPFEVILSNPPYVSRSEYEQLDAEVRNYEPQSALLAGENGTEIIERLLPEAHERLMSGGMLALELSPMIAKSVAALFSPTLWSEPRTLKDLAGHERIVTAVKQ